MELRITSCQAEIAEPFCSALADYLASKLTMRCQFVGDVSWQERERLLLRGEVQFGWVCGLAYVRHNADTQAAASRRLELVAAPVRSHARYQGQPVYYSDVLVRAASPWQSFADLRDTTCAYNEPGSHSGCNILRYHLASRGLGADYFGRIVESGSHRNSLRLLRSGGIDTAAIDSTVLELETLADPTLARDLRVIASLGPSPAPPWVAHTSVPAPLRDVVREMMLAMSADPHAASILHEARMSSFASVSDADYDPIREMDRIAAPVNFSLV